MTNMGRSLSKHGGTFTAGGWAWYLVGVLTLAGVLGLFGGLWAIVSGAAVAAPDSGLPRVLTALVALAIAPIVAIWPAIQWRQTLEIFEEGLVWRRPLFGEKQIAASALRSVTHFALRGISTGMNIRLKDNTEIYIRGLDHPEQAVNMIRQLAGGPAAPAAAAGWSPPAPGGWQPPGGGA